MRISRFIVGKITKTKYCKGCDKDKPLKDFTKDVKRPDGLYFYCRTCERQRSRKYYYERGGKETSHQRYLKHREKKIAYSKEYRKNNPGCRRREQLSKMSKQTGLSIDEIEKFYNKQFKKQQGQCVICGKHQTELNCSLNIDHDHNTNKLRALLCPTCNIGIGNLQDDAELCLKAYQYLREH